MTRRAVVGAAAAPVKARRRRVPAAGYFCTGGLLVLGACAVGGGGDDGGVTLAAATRPSLRRYPGHAVVATEAIPPPPPPDGGAEAARRADPDLSDADRNLAQPTSSGISASAVLLPGSDPVTVTSGRDPLGVVFSGVGPSLPGDDDCTVAADAATNAINSRLGPDGVTTVNASVVGEVLMNDDADLRLDFKFTASYAPPPTIDFRARVRKELKTGGGADAVMGALIRSGSAYFAGLSAVRLLDEEEGGGFTSGVTPEKGEERADHQTSSADESAGGYSIFSARSSSGDTVDAATGMTLTGGIAPEDLEEGSKRPGNGAVMPLPARDGPVQTSKGLLVGPNYVESADTHSRAVMYRSAGAAVLVCIVVAVALGNVAVHTRGRLAARRCVKRRMRVRRARDAYEAPWRAGEAAPSGAGGPIPAEEWVMK